MQTDKNIILFIMNLPFGTAEAVKEYEKELGRPLRIMLLRDSRIRPIRDMSDYPTVDLFESCDFSKPEKIAETLLSYQDQILAVTCRSEAHLSRFAAVLPHIPYVLSPTAESLRWAADKYEMRKRLRMHDSSITPNFTLVKQNTKSERERVVQKIGFPMIVKPTNLAASLFVSICYHEEELEQVLRNLFRKIKKAYDSDSRQEPPKVIAEEYMEGDMYSVDSYVNARGKVYHCPLVKVTTGKDIGHDDFYNYLQMTPTALKATTVERAQEVAEKAIHAIGLRSSIAHTELMKIDDEWKVIEIGARMGGFRHTLHKLSCDINHALNDVLIRIPKKPVIPKKCKGYACTIKWFAKKEGTISEMKGIKKLEQLKSFQSIVQNKKVGDRAVFARNGGRSIFNLFLYNDDRSKLLADIRRIEKMVQVRVAPRKNGSTTTAKKKVVKKVTKKKPTRKKR